MVDVEVSIKLCVVMVMTYASACKNAKESNFLNGFLHEDFRPFHEAQLYAQITFFVQLFEFLQIVGIIGIISGQTGCTSHEIWWQLAEGRASAPQKCLETNFAHDAPQRWFITGIGTFRTDDSVHKVKETN